MFAPRVKWQSLEKSVEEIKMAAEKYENAFNDIMSTIKEEQNFQKVGIFVFCFCFLFLIPLSSPIFKTFFNFFNIFLDQEGKTLLVKTITSWNIVGFLEDLRLTFKSVTHGRMIEGLKGKRGRGALREDKTPLLRLLSCIKRLYCRLAVNFSVAVVLF